MSVGPVLQAGDTTRNALLQLAKILNRAKKLPSKIEEPETETHITQHVPNMIVKSPRVLSTSPKLLSSIKNGGF